MRLVSSLDHSSWVIGCSVHDSINTNIELVEEGVNLKQSAF